MNWMKKGPELKLSELKVPDFLYDLFYDLKERHLLPLVALLIVAMIGAPIYFRSSTKSDPEPAVTPGGATATASTAADTGETLVVARSEPGLRDYRERLKKYRELDPFGERGGKETAAEAEGSASEGATATVAPAEATVIREESGGVSEAPVESIPYAPESFESGAEESGSTGDTGGDTRTRYASNAIDVRIVAVPSPSDENRAKEAEPKAQVRRNLPELTMLPSRQTPAATYIGLTNDGKKALFVVSSDVVSLFGEGICVIGSQSCQLLALEPGLPETFVYGPQERTYRIELLKINKTYSAKPRRATLGATNGKHHSNGAKGTGEGGGPTGKEPAERG
ncbi:MAG TPA: hypothetical protein VJL81_00845 [Solirubrobacterales bacterium]|nr:hypothetical protein [Solirubrobacterales bacterium]